MVGYSSPDSRKQSRQSHHGVEHVAETNVSLPVSDRAANLFLTFGQVQNSFEMLGAKMYKVDAAVWTNRDESEMLQTEVGFVDYGVFALGHAILEIWLQSSPALLA